MLFFYSNALQKLHELLPTILYIFTFFPTTAQVAFDNFLHFA